MNLPVILIEVLQAYNTRQVQHLFRLVKQSSKKACLEALCLVEKRLKTVTQSKMGGLISPCHSPAFKLEEE